MPLMVLFFLGTIFFSLASLADDFTQGAKLGVDYILRGSIVRIYDPFFYDLLDTLVNEI